MTQKRTIDTRWMLALTLLLCLVILGITTRVTAGEGEGGDLDQLEAASPEGLTRAEWVSIQSQIAAENEFTPGSGSATYPAQYHTDSWSHRHQVKLANPDPADGDRFGYSVAVSGDTAVIGAPGDGGYGSAYVFVRSGTAWNQQVKLTAEDAEDDDRFGFSVAVSGDTIVVGAPGHGGSAHIFVRDAGIWSSQATLLYLLDGDDMFGHSVAVSGNTVLIGAPWNDTAYGRESKVDSGIVFIYQREGEDWEGRGALYGPSFPHALYGYSVAVSGDTVVIGAPNYGIGAAHVFLSPRTFQTTLFPSGTASATWFGHSVAISGDTVVIGAPGHNGSESAYVFAKAEGASWSLQGKLSTAQVTGEDSFGSVVAVSGDKAVIGAHGDDDAGEDAGSAYVFARRGTVWSPQTKLTAADAGGADWFGSAVAISGDVAVVGAYGDDDGAEDAGSACAVDLGDLEATMPVTIGVAASFSGNELQNQYGWQQLNSVQLAVSETNQAGGILVDGLYYTVTLAVEDGGCDPTQSETAANNLLAAGAVAVVGHSCSHASKAAAPIYQAAEVAMITPSASDPTLTQQGYTTTFRTASHAATGCSGLAGRLYDLGLERTAILRRDGLWSDSLAQAYTQTYEVLGGTIVSDRTLASTGEVTDALTLIQGEGAQAIYVTDIVGDIAGEVSRVAHGLGMTQTIGMMAPIDEYINDYAGPLAAEGDYAPIGEKRPVDMPGYAPFEAAYLAAGFANEPAPGGFSPTSYDAAMIIFDAIQRAGTTTDTLTIRDAIAATTNYPGVSGTYERFDENGDVVPQWSRINVVLNGVWVPASIPGEFYRGLGGTFDLDNAMGTETTIEIPPELEPEPLVAGNSPQTPSADSLRTTYTILFATTDGGDASLTMMGGNGLRLEANAPLSPAVTLTVAYKDDDLYGLDEDSLKLFTRDGGQWVDAQPCGGYVRDTANNTLQAIICELGDLILLGKRQSVVYLPLVVRNVP